MKSSDPSTTVLVTIMRKGEDFPSLRLTHLDYAAGSGVIITKDPDQFTLEDNPLLHRGNTHQTFDNRILGVMSCGHVVSPTPLTEYIKLELAAGKFTIHCPFSDPNNPLAKCNKEWPYKELRKLACLTLEEKAIIEKKLTENLLVKSPKITQCRDCGAYVERRNVPGANRITCQLCTRLNQATPFCFKCMHIWTTNLIDFCGNAACSVDSRIEVLENASMREFYGTYLSPSIRACPKCGILVELVGIPACRTVMCLCGVKFCFICLDSKPGEAPRALCFDNATHNTSRPRVPMELKPECVPKPTQTLLVIQSIVQLRKNLDKYYNL